jgi:four helix bundle protein
MGASDRHASSENSKKYDLEDRTFHFAKSVRAFVRRVPMSLAHHEDLKQLIRSSGSVGANYIEANESLSRKDFLLRIRICREAKECRYWLRLLELEDKTAQGEERAKLASEAWELTNIFGAILRKSEANRSEVNSKPEIPNPKRTV